MTPRGRGGQAPDPVGGNPAAGASCLAYDTANLPTFDKVFDGTVTATIGPVMRSLIWRLDRGGELRRSGVVQRRWLVVLASLALVAAGVLGAAGDWVWWEPYKGVIITLAAGGFLLVAIVLAALRRTRSAALIVAAIGVGLIAGQNLGPSRPQLQYFEGTMTVTLTGPRATSGSAPVSCAMDATANELSLSGDPNLRLDIVADDPAAPADVDQREFVGVSLTVGDRWEEDPTGRPDGVALRMTVGRAEADLPETRSRSAPSSVLEMDRSATGGTLSFAGLVPDLRADEAAGPPIDLAGALRWTCDVAVREE